MREAIIQHVLLFCARPAAGELLDHAGGYIDPLRVVSQIPEHMQASGSLMHQPYASKTHLPHCMHACMI